MVTVGAALRPVETCRRDVPGTELCRAPRPGAPVVAVVADPALHIWNTRAREPEPSGPGPKSDCHLWIPNPRIRSELVRWVRADPSPAPELGFIARVHDRYREARLLLLRLLALCPGQLAGTLVR